MEVQRATQAHVPGIASLNNTVQRMHAEEHPHIFKYPTDPSEVEAFFSGRVDCEGNFVFVTVTEGGEIAGYIWAAIECRDENPFKFARGVMYIHQIAVAPEQRRSGVGSRLVERVEECASELRLQTLALDSWTFNTEAHEFFRKLGFTEYRLDMWKTIDKSSTMRHI